MELTQLRYFITVAKSSSMAAAAFALNVSQSTLSVSIKALETELGVPLFVKRGRCKELTDAGLTFLNGVQSMLAGLDDLKEQMNYYSAAESSKLLTIAMEAVDFATEVILSYRTLHPEVDIMQVRPNRKTCRELLMNRADLCIGLFDDTTYEFESRKVFSDRFCLLVHCQSPLIGRGSVTMREIAEETLITLPREFGLRQQHELMYLEAGIRLHRAFEVGDPEVLPLPVQNSHGVTFISQTQYSTVSHMPKMDESRVLLNYDSLQRVVALPIRDVPASHDVYITTYRKNKLSPICRDFIQFAELFGRESEQAGVFATRNYDVGKINPFISQNSTGEKSLNDER